VNISGNTVLITGGATGIGFSLAEEFIKADNEVIICGRRKEKLEEAKSKLPKVHTKVCDVSDPKERESLFSWIISDFASINVLINNAGIQRMIDLRGGIGSLTGGESEIDINFTSAVYLSAHFIPVFIQRKEAAIINVTSGLAFVPIAVMPVYCATKAALHSFSISLRHQLKGTPIKVFEIIPPTVDTELDRGTRARRNITYRGIPPSEVATSTMKALERDEFEHAVDQAKDIIEASRSNFEGQFSRMNS
jgi:uncharacterized oxidoreductase